ncbi:18801_t:CDS:2 [Acaulospora morrowiae]|uniref:18801_t:CDS:1 n=1 Tax=Acaulospora morrowiae TaxID=94023 RepID=A0A9N9HMP0_9GLOM|nr:18801_t:CDS:2 [Acaulospora morrowiae]
MDVLVAGQDKVSGIKILTSSREIKFFEYVEYVAPKGHMQKGYNSTTRRLGGSVKFTPALRPSPLTQRSSKIAPSTTQRSQRDGIGQWQANKLSIEVKWKTSP